MKMYLALLLTLIVVLAGCTPAVPVAPVATEPTAPVVEQPAVAPTANIEVTRKGFVPNELTVKKGTVVTWTNTDTIPHTVTVYGHSKYTGKVAAGKTHTVVFDELGEFNYINGALGLKGKVIVE
jgi:plastocyanin